MIPLLHAWRPPRDAGGRDPVPVLEAYVDWSGRGFERSFIGGALGTASARWAPAAIARVRPLSATWRRGIAADYGGDQTGGATLVLANDDGAYDRDRNWCDNPSFEEGLFGWERGLTLAGYPANRPSRLWRPETDAAPGAGVACAEIVWEAANGIDAAVGWAIPYDLRAGRPYTVALSLRRTSGSGWLQWGIGSAGDTTQRLVTFVGPGPGWARVTLTWTPTADVSDALIWLAGWGALTSTVRLDAVSLSPGTTAPPYIEAPTRGNLVPGRRVLLRAPYGSGIHHLFSGRIVTISPEVDSRTVTLACHGPEQDMTDTVVAVNRASVSHGRLRTRILDAVARTGANLAANPSFEHDLTGVRSVPAGTISRVAGGVDGEWCLRWAPTGAHELYLESGLLPITTPGQPVTGALWLRTVSGTASIGLRLLPDAVWPGVSTTISIDATWRRYSIAGTVTAATFATDATWPRAPLLYLAAPAGGGEFLVDAVSIVTGRGAPALRPSGIGRYLSMIPDADADAESGAVSTWWRAPWPNIVPNPSFEDGTTRGWTADAGLALANGGEHAAFGGRSLRIDLPADGTVRSARLTVTGSFAANTTYRVLLRSWRRVTNPAFTMSIRVRLAGGTPTAYDTGGDSTAWKTIIASWTPTAPATSAVIEISVFATTSSGGSFWIDGLTLTDRPAGTDGGAYDFSDPFAGGFSAGGVVAAAATVGDGRAGGRAIRLDYPAGPARAICYDLTGTGAVFWPGRPYVASFWCRLVSGTTDWRAAIGQGGLDEAHVDFVPTSAWQRVILPWVPTRFHDTGDTSRSRPWTPVALAIGSPTGSGPSVLLIEGLRIEPGVPALDPEPGWLLDSAERDMTLYRTGSGIAIGSGGAGELLGGLGVASLSRTAMLPAGRPPWWRYRVTGRAAATTDPASDAIDAAAAINALSVDRASMASGAEVWYRDAGGTNRLVARFDDRADLTIDAPPIETINAPELIGTVEAATDIATRLLAHRRLGARRPQVTVVNRFPAGLARDVGDRITLRWPSVRPVELAHYRILGITTVVSEAGQRWETTYATEELAT